MHSFIHPFIHSSNHAIFATIFMANKDCRCNFRRRTCNDAHVT